jgi:hypothetical protein
MWGFGKKTPKLSDEDKKRILNAVAVSVGEGNTTELRRLIADQMGENISPDGPEVNALIEDLALNARPAAAVKANVPFSQWWESATPADRKVGIEIGLAYMTSR